MNIIHFSANLKTVKVKEEYQNPTSDQLKKTLETAHAIISHEMYSFAPIKKQEIERVAGASLSKISNFSTLKEAISTIKPGKLQDELKPFSTPTLKQDDDGKNELRQKGADQIAFNYYLLLLLNKCFPVEAIKRNDKLEKNELRLVANTEVTGEEGKQAWQVIRKSNLDIASNGEVFSTMIAIGNAINPKLPLFFNESHNFNQLVKKHIPAEGSKSFAKLIAAFQSVDEKELQSLKDKLLQRLFVLKLMEGFGFYPFTSVETFNDAFPELKLAKPKGNFGKKKK